MGNSCGRLFQGDILRLCRIRRIRAARIFETYSQLPLLRSRQPIRPCKKGPDGTHTNDHYFTPLTGYEIPRKPPRKFESNISGGQMGQALC
jgi:hypothetical protein